MRLKVEMPELGVETMVTLYDHAAPSVCKAIFESVSVPLEARTAHACFDGHVVFCFLREFGEPPPLENCTMRPMPGELMFFYAPNNAFAFLQEDRLAPGGATVHELAFVYGAADLRHFWEEGWHGSLVGRITAGFDQFAQACAGTLSDGSTVLRISQASGRSAKAGRM